MRLHELQVTAFGPFADAITVDFDDLSASGLFLLTGPTGAGKTSVLDAVCFALYGEVPGDRQSAKRLRSDQAADGVAPQVTLEVSLAGRRFRIIRSPAWERPKKRGSGTTTEQASVRLSERRHGQWHQLSHRLDETGHLVTELLGMSFTQFCQVAMLPQGRFQAFLRARSEERQRLLQQLFRTQRFEDIERWLRDRRKLLRRDSSRHQESVAALLSRTSETAGAPLPEEWRLHDLAPHASDGSLRSWSVGLHERAADHAADATAEATAAAAAAAAAQDALEQARALALQQQAHADATVAHRELAEAAPAQARRRHALDRARRAGAVLPFQEIADHHRRVAADAAAAELSSLRQLAGALDRPSDAVRRLLDDPAALDALEGDAADRAAAARALLPRERSLASLRVQQAAGHRRVAELEQATAGLASELGAIPLELAEVRRQLAEATDARRSLPACRERAQRIRLRLAASAQASALATDLASAREQLLTVGEELHRHKETWLQLQEERISGMAAELAGALAVGADCPVCGSHDHPRPAAPRPGAPDASAEKAARRRVDDAEALRHLHEEKVRDLTTRIAIAREQAAGEPGVEAALPAAEAEIAHLADLAAAAEPLAADERRLETRCAELTTAREAALVELAEARAEVEVRTAEIETIADAVEAVLAGGPASSLADSVAQGERVITACRRVRTALLERQRAREAEERASARCEAAAREAGFAEAAAAVTAVLTRDELDTLAAEVAAHDAALTAVTRQLEDDALLAAAALPPPDLDGLADTHREASETLDEARTRAAISRTCAERLAGLDAQLGAALSAWAPVRAELDLVTRIAGLAEGTSPDNRLHMRLSAFVLAWRLTQVVAAANERLGRMSDHRYSLEHTGRRGAGETRGGLSLLVRDDWSGESRDPATLSGGETFVVSLALALGLADVIAHEVGGADLDTLFVDEGFGSLDADTLDDVLGTLDTLREGGRVVGVVSHVAEMRDRIPAQLRVAKSRRGSSVVIAR